MNAFSTIFRLTDELLKRTTSRCPVCHAACPAEVRRTGSIPSKVLLKRTCPEHGEATVCIASDARFYWLAKGKSENSCCDASQVGRAAPCAPSSKISSDKSVPADASLSPSDGERAGVRGSVNCCSAASVPSLAALPSTINAQPSTCLSADGTNSGTLGRNANPGDAIGVMEKLSTCLALIEIVNSCNLSCPTCYADSPLGTGQKVDAIPLADLQHRIQGVIDRKGGIEILQLSGGEPTLHPEFFELLRWLHANPGIDYALLNTNGVRIANDEAFARELATTFRYGKFQLYLQFDGVQEAGQKYLRGADLRETRERCLERCQEMKLPVTLAMTVTPENLPNLWEAITFGLRWPNVRGISFQPMFNSGRTPVRSPAFRRLPELSEGETPNHDFRAPPLNTADIILAAVGQSGGKLRFDDFTPLPCGDPNCATIGYLLKLDGQVRSVSDFIDFKNVQDFLGTKVRYKLEDLMKCGCDSEPLGELLKQFELDETHTFRLFIKPFMDAQTWDEDRIDRCCTHVIRPDGKLDSFCRYYSGFADCKV